MDINSVFTHGRQSPQRNRSLFDGFHSWIAGSRQPRRRRAAKPDFAAAALVQTLESRRYLSATTPQLAIPPTIYSIVGESTRIAFENLVPTLSTDDLRFEVVCDIGASSATDWAVTPEAADVGDHVWQISLWQGETLVASRSSVIRVSPTVDSGRDYNLLLVGDSLTHYSLYPNDLAIDFAHDGRAVTLLGTHHPEGAAPNVFHEGYGGWTWNRFLTHYEPNPDPLLNKRSSPFVFLENGRATLNVSRYFADSLGGAKPDFVTFLLGINDCISLDPSRPDLVDRQIDAVLTSAESLLSAFRTALPDAEFGICLTPPPNARESAFTANYAGRYTRENWKPVQHRLVEKMIDRFSGREADCLFIVPTGLNMSPADSYPVDNAVHPNERGYSEIAANIRSWLQTRMQPRVPALVNSEIESSLDENSTVGTVVGQLTVEKTIPSRRPVYSIVDGPAAAAFAIDPVTGVLRVTNPALLDFESSPALQFTVSVSDPYVPAVSTRAAVTVNLRDVNEAPTAVALDRTVFILPEMTDTTSRIKLADITVVDDFTGVNTLTLSGPDADQFEIDHSALYLRAGVILDFEAKTKHLVTIDADDVSIGTTPDASATIALNVTNVNEPPLLGGSAANFVVDDSATLSPFAGLTVSDPDQQDLFARVTIANGVYRGDFTPFSAANWIRTANGSDIVYTQYFPSQPNTAAVVESSIRRFVFQPRENAIKPNLTEQADVTVFVNDGFAPALLTSRITTFSRNNAPVISGVQRTLSVADNALANPFAALTITDQDTQDMALTVTILNGVVRGDFVNALSAGFTSRQIVGNDIVYRRYFGLTADVGAAAQAVLRTLIFQPRSNVLKPGAAELTDFLFTVSDGTEPPITNRETRLTTLSVNDAPVISGTSRPIAVNDQSSVAPFAGVMIADDDVQALFASVTILNGAHRGDFVDAAAAGWTSRKVVGNDVIYTRTFEIQPRVGAAAEAALRALIFRPRQNATRPGGTELTDFLITVSDGVASPSSDARTRITTTSINDAPVVTGLIDNVAVDDNATVNPFGSITVTDPDTQESLVTVTIVNGAYRGDFQNAANSGWNSRTVVGNDITYARYFTPTSNVGKAAEAALKALAFQPRANAIRPGSTELTNFRIIISDGAAPPIVNSATNVTTRSVNDPPTITVEAGNPVLTPGSPFAPFSTMNVSDSDNQDLLVEVTIADSAQRGDLTPASTTGWTRTIRGTTLIYTRYFYPAARIGATVQAALRSLMFQASTPNVATVFSVTLKDGSGAAATKEVTVTTQS